MRIVVVNTEYTWFLVSLYRDTPGLETRPYDEQLDERNATLFGVSDAYPAAFRSHGHDAVGIYANNRPLQLAWAREHGHRGLVERLVRGRPAGPRGRARRAVGRLRGVPAPLLDGGASRRDLQDVALAQIADYRPDLVLNQDMFFFDATALREIRSGGALLVGQHAASPLGSAPVHEYDLVVSSFMPTVEKLRRRGVDARLNRLAFDPRALSAIGDAPGRVYRWDLTFVGSLQPIHRSRLLFLEELAARVPELSVWTPDLRYVPRSSPIRRRYVGAVWGRHMYEVLRDSRVTLNHHGDVEPYANNMRLYEATGVGTALLTDRTDNLADLFVPGVEVLTYGSAAECAEVFAQLTSEARDAIAAAGQARTLRDHTYETTVAELLDLVASAAASRACGRVATS